jgi:hypothetical protein
MMPFVVTFRLPFMAALNMASKVASMTVKVMVMRMAKIMIEEEGTIRVAIIVIIWVIAVADVPRGTTR